MCFLRFCLIQFSLCSQTDVSILYLLLWYFVRHKEKRYKKIQNSNCTPESRVKSKSMNINEWLSELKLLLMWHLSLFPILDKLPQYIQKEQTASHHWLTAKRGGAQELWCWNDGNCQNARGKVMEIKRLRILEEVSWCSAKAAFRKVFANYCFVLKRKVLSSKFWLSTPMIRHGTKRGIVVQAQHQPSPAKTSRAAFRIHCRGSFKQVGMSVVYFLQHKGILKATIFSCQTQQNQVKSRTRLTLNLNHTY